MRACRPGATGTRRSATAAASMPATRTATASARCTSTQWRVSGHCSAPGCVRIAASRRRSCQSISASLSSCTTRAGAEKPCSVPLSLLWSGDALHHPGSRQEPYLFAETGEAAAWVKNIRRNPEVVVRINERRIGAIAHVLDRESDRELWHQVAAIADRKYG